MSDDNASSTATATAAPPDKPPAPPATGAAAPGPDRRRPRSAGCAVAAVAIVAIVAAGIGAFWLVSQRVSNVAVVTPANSAAGTPFASAMRKAGVQSPPAPSPAVELTSVHALGSHQFDATFTPAEISALLQAFTYTPPTGTRLSVRVDKLEVTGLALTLTGNVNAGGSSYTGAVTSQVRFSAGSIQADGVASANVGGVTVNGAQASQAVGVLLDYFNAYVAAAPGLKISSAQLVGGNVHVTGTAPDTLSW